MESLGVGFERKRARNSGFFPRAQAVAKEKEWWLTILIINGKPGPDSMNGKAANAKEIARKLCYIIHQEKITRR
jgi:hypothetical protein